MVEVHVSQLRIFLSAKLLKTLALLFLACTQLQPSHVNCGWIQPCCGRDASLTFMELSSEKELLVAKHKYNALSGCFILTPIGLYKE